MPALSPTMSEGAIVKWHKKEGKGLILCCGVSVGGIETSQVSIVREILHFALFPAIPLVWLNFEKEQIR